ncbi:MAG: hypothetical protein AAB403_03015 [Planctomycetota bacterium]
MAKKKVTKKPARKLSARQVVVQAALQTTFVLKGSLKRVQRMYLHVGALLVKVRDQKMYEALGHPDIENYAQQRLSLGRASLYRYLNVYEWVAKSHPEWLKSGTKGTIPDLSDTANLIWIDTELSRKGVDPDRKAGLEALQKKALDGSLRKSEFNTFRRQGNKSQASLKSYLSKVRLIRKRGAQLVGVPKEVLDLFDTAIGILKNRSL